VVFCEALLIMFMYMGRDLTKPNLMT